MKFIFWVAALIGVQVIAQPPLTSDRATAGVIPAAINPMSLPARAPIYVPPHDDIFDVLVTNTRPLVVEVTIWSNEVRRTIWYKNGQARTNETILSTNIVSQTTNTVTR